MRCWRRWGGDGGDTGGSGEEEEGERGGVGGEHYICLMAFPARALFPLRSACKVRRGRGAEEGEVDG